MNQEEMKEFVRSVRDKIKVTRVICSRTVKCSQGDVFVSLSSCWNTLFSGGPEEEVSAGMTLKEAKMTAYLLGLDVDQIAFARAMAGGLMTSAEYEKGLTALRNNYSLLTAQLLGSKDGGS